MKSKKKPVTQDDVDMYYANIMFSKKPVSQADFARAFGVDPAVISRLVARGILTANSGVGWTHQYVAYKQGLEAGRRGSGLY